MDPLLGAVWLRPASPNSVHSVTGGVWWGYMLGRGYLVAAGVQHLALPRPCDDARRLCSGPLVGLVHVRFSVRRWYSVRVADGHYRSLQWRSTVCLVAVTAMQHGCLRSATGAPAVRDGHVGALVGMQCHLRHRWLPEPDCYHCHAGHVWRTSVPRLTHSVSAMQQAPLRSHQLRGWRLVGMVDLHGRVRQRHTAADTASRDAGGQWRPGVRRLAANATL